MNFGNLFEADPDWMSINESDGMRFYGFDNEEEGTTEWYDKNGNLDCTTDMLDEHDEDDYTYRLK